MKNRAIVLSEDHYNALGIIRSLGEAGFSVDLILTTEAKHTYVDKSRYVTNVIRVSHDDQMILEAINLFSNNCEKPYLFPLSDYTAMIVDKNARYFNENIVCPQMNGEMQTYQDKINSKELAKKCGMKTAKYVRYAIGDDMNWTIFPAIIKPLVSQEGSKSDITIVDNLEELNEALLRFGEKHYKQLLIEEYLTGENEHMVEVLGCVFNGNVFIGGIVKKVREFPMKRGSTSYAQIVSEHEGVDLVLVNDYIKKTNFDGLFDVEFKYVDGSGYFIECNFRNGAPGYAFTQVGCNLAENWILGKNGKELRTVNYNSNMFFMCEQTDILNALKREVKLNQWIKEYLSSRKVFFIMNDMRPVIYYYSLFLGMIIKRLFRKNK